MSTYLTETLDGSFAGPNVYANTRAEAARQAEARGVRVVGMLVEEIPASDELVDCIRRGLQTAELSAVG